MRVLFANPNPHPHPNPNTNPNPDPNPNPGEMDLWRKMSNFELAVRVPLLMRVPWRPASLGRR